MCKGGLHYILDNDIMFTFSVICTYNITIFSS